LSNFQVEKFDSQALARRYRARSARLLALALPQLCALCRASAGVHLLCDACVAALPSLGAACARCALPSTKACCPACRRRPPPWLRAHAAWRYAFPVDRLLQGLKYGGELALARPLGEGLANALLDARAERPDGLVAMPLASARARKRGFNQSRLIASVLARALGVPLHDALARRRETPPQAGLSLAARAANVAGAFHADAREAGRHLPIVYDVMTTGASLAAATQAALQAGARRIDVWVCARTPPPDDR
jgi:ComF family protein